MFKHRGKMTEDFLHYLWRFKIMKPGPWQDAEGAEVRLIHPGYYNTNSGPDFEEAQLIIGKQMWVGSVEIHIRSSDWNRHAHQKDRAYNNVILHVVYECDAFIKTQNGQRPPCLEIKSLIDEQLYWRYEQALNSPRLIPCEKSFKDVNRLSKQQMLDRCAVQRMEDKALYYQEVYKAQRGNWQALLYQALARAFGAKVNSLGMELLCKSLPLEIWQSYQSHPLERSILFLGTAGLLERGDSETTAWRREFRFLKHKHNISSIEKSTWKYARMRPSSFPDRRIAQLALILPEALNWFEAIRIGNSDAWEALSWPGLDPYWENHYRIGAQSAKRMGVEWSRQMQNHLKINVFIPLMFFYGMKTGKLYLKDQALQALEQLPAEDNKISRVYEQLALPIRSAYDSQALIAWYEHYCQPKKCLTCTLGNELLNQGM